MRRAILIGKDLVIRQIEGIFAPHQSDQIVPKVFSDDVVLRDQDDILAGFSPKMGSYECARALAEMGYLRALF